MSRQMESQLVSVAIAVVIIAFVMVRRMRPQPVRPNALLVRALILMAVLVGLLIFTGKTLLSETLVLAFAPVAIVAGGGLGWVVVRLMKFWTDPESGQLWMRGGILFMLVYLVTFGTRIASGFLSGAYGGGAPSVHAPWLAGLSTDLIFLSLGLWAARTALVYWRYRQHLAQGGVPTGGARTQY